MQSNNLIELLAQCLARAKPPDVKVSAEGEVVNVTLCETITLILPSKAISPSFLPSQQSPSSSSFIINLHRVLITTDIIIIIHRVYINTFVHRVLVATKINSHILSCFHTINNTYLIAQDGRASAAHGLRLADRHATYDWRTDSASRKFDRTMYSRQGTHHPGLLRAWQQQRR
jgi:hypothetical protein